MILETESKKCVLLELWKKVQLSLENMAFSQVEH